MFEVWRQDDNGNRYLVSSHSGRVAAEAAVAGLEAGVQHKQLYFVVERVSGHGRQGSDERGIGSRDG